MYHCNLLIICQNVNVIHVYIKIPVRIRHTFCIMLHVYGYGKFEWEYQKALGVIGLSFSVGNSESMECYI